MVTDWTSSVGQDFEPATWDECLKILLSLGGDNVLYRGHARFDWELATSLERALLENSEQFDERAHGLMLSMAADSTADNWASDVERVLTQRFRQQAISFDIPNLPPLWDRLGWWEVMQHHGAPTRLMDWTNSPFIGLWFAVEYHRDGDGDMALWVYDRRTASANLMQVIAAIKSSEDYDLLDYRQLQNQLVQLATTGEWTAVLIPVKPRQFQRAVAQQSVLTITSRIGVARPADWWIRRKLATRIRIKEDWKSEIQTACLSMGYSRVSLFRDLDSLGASIRKNFISKKYLSDLGLF